MIGISTTTAQLRGAIPWESPHPLGLVRVPVGIDAHTGSAFCFDPFQAYQRGIVTDPVMLVLGSKGSGKSTLVKSLAIRMAAHGYLIRHVDPKGEGHPLAEFFGVDPIRPGRVIINPFEGLRRDERGRMGIALVSAALDRPLTPVEAAAVTTAAGVTERLNLEVLAERLASPADLLSPLVITDRDVRELIAGLHTLRSSNAGRMMFGDSTATVDASAPYLGVDLSGHDDDTLRVLMVAVTGWITGLWGTDRLRPKVVIMDEFWRLLTDRATAEWAKHAFKMSREHGASYIAVLQHLGDLRSVDQDTRAIAHGLLADSETRIVYRQPPDQAPALGELLGLSAEETSIVQRLVPGQALWRVGGRSTVVEHIVTDIERPLIDTNLAMGGRHVR
jgi:type IV secretory pathway VirB4 component